MNYNQKTVKLSKKAKVKSLNNIIKLLIENKYTFNVDQVEISIESKREMYGYCLTIPVNKCGKEIKIKEAEIEYDFGFKGKVDSIHYNSSKMEIEQEFSFLFTGLPKLTKEQLEQPQPPPQPKVVAELAAGNGHDIYSMNMHDDGTLKVGCSKFSKKQVKNIKEFLNNNS